MDRKLCYWARLAASSPRYEEWHAIFGSDDVPLISPASGRAKLGQETEEIHLLDVMALNALQRERLIVHLARRFRVYPGDVRPELLRNRTFPIRASDIIVAFDLCAWALHLTQVIMPPI